MPKSVSEHNTGSCPADIQAHRLGYVCSVVVTCGF